TVTSRLMQVQSSASRVLRNEHIIPASSVRKQVVNQNQIHAGTRVVLSTHSEQGAGSTRRQQDTECSAVPVCILNPFTGQPYADPPGRWRFEPDHGAQCFPHDLSATHPVDPQRRTV